MPFDGLPNPFRQPGAIPQGAPQLDPNDPINAGLTGLWPLDGTLLDLSGRGNDAQPAGAPGWAPSPLGLALSCSGASQFLKLAASPLAPADLSGHNTICLWVSLADNTSQKTILEVSTDGTTGNGFRFLVANSGTPRVTLAIGGTTGGSIASEALTLNAWYHLALQITSPAAVNFFINGVLVGSGSATVLGFTAANQIGAQSVSGSNSWQGGLAGLRVYARALTPAEIMRLYTDPFAGLVFPSDRLWLWQGAGSGISVSAAALLPLEWQAADIAPVVRAARLLASAGRVRILASAGRRRLLASPGRVRLVQLTNR